MTIPMAAVLTALPGPARGQAPSEVRDGARMFTDRAVEEASAALRDLAKRHGTPIVIETIESLPAGSTIETEAMKRFNQLGGRSVFIMIADREHKTSPVQLPPALAGRIKPDQLGLVRESFTADFKARRFDEGLKTAVDTIGRVLADARIADPAAPSLVRRDQVRLNLSGARVILEAAEARATEMGLKENVAVVDDGGHLIAFVRMDGARPASISTALTKAISAATTRAATGPLPAGAATPDLLLNLSLQNAALAGGGRFTALKGGVPIEIDGQIIGAVGAGGGTGEQDAEVAKAGIAALMTELEPRRP